MACSPEEVRAFIADAKDARRNWLTWADRSWAEVKKRQRNNTLLSVNPNTAKKRAKYPVWASLLKIRQPLLLSRIGIPICKDATQDGSDTVGASAAFFKERLAVNLAKSFDFFDALCTARDDFLVTDFGILRAYYERDEVKERVKQYITPTQVPGSEEVVFVDAEGNIVESDDIAQDEDGYFVETDEVVSVENERVYLGPTLYKEAYIDPDVRRWPRVERLAFEIHFSVPSFKETFGAKALADLAKPDDEGEQSAKKKQTIIVYEYWDKYEREVYWLPENGKEFVKPLKMHVPEEFLEGEQPNGLYNLDRFFPCPIPLMTNQPTDEFWPVPEYYQLVEIIEDVHVIFSRMMSLTRAIRARLLFDNNVEGLQEALSEASEGDAFGVPNLAQALITNGGSLEQVCQYIPVEKMIGALQQIYTALEQRLNTIYRLTGVSDLLQGLISDGTQRTFGERQMLEKYALNQHAEPQRKMQEFVKDCYELLCEMALKNFEDESLERYMMPRTAPEAHKNNFLSALALLKDDRKRFRIDLETDSTVALNEQYDKQMRAELVNTLTSAIEKVAQVATTQPALLAIELHALKFMIQGFRQGKAFQEEITQAIDLVIEQTATVADAPAGPNPEQIKLEIEQQRLGIEQQKVVTEAKLKEYQILSNERIETARLQLEQQVSSVKSQLEQMRLEAQTSESLAQQQLDFEKVRNDISVAQAELAQKSQELQIQIARLDDDRTRAAYEAAATERLGMIDLELKTAAQRLEEYKVQIEESRAAMEMQERWATEQRLQQEAELNKMLKQLELVQKNSEAQNQAIIAMAQAKAVSAPPPPKGKKKIRVQRDEGGNMTGIEVEGGEGYQVIRDQNGDIIGYEPTGSI